jgi:lysophospholipid acyltransferase (LPLAT)-like uncharacterized protein
LRRGLKFALAGSVGHALASALLSTVRFRAEHRERLDVLMARGEPVLFALWHGRLLPLTWFHRHRDIAAMISYSEDGEYIARLVGKWGYRVVRGSTSRGGLSALRELARQVRSGRSVAITPDGPRGPRQRLQPGIIAVARMTGAPIVPLVAGCDRAWWPGQWDRFCIPKPFSRVTVLYGEPQYVPRDADATVQADCARRLEDELNTLLGVVDGLQQRD